MGDSAVSTCVREAHGPRERGAEIVSTATSFLFYQLFALLEQTKTSSHRLVFIILQNSPQAPPPPLLSLSFMHTATASFSVFVFAFAFAHPSFYVTVVTTVISHGLTTISTVVSLRMYQMDGRHLTCLCLHFKQVVRFLHCM